MKKGPSFTEVVLRNVQRERDDLRKLLNIAVRAAGEVRYGCVDAVQASEGTIETFHDSADGKDVIRFVPARKEKP